MLDVLDYRLKKVFLYFFNNIFIKFYKVNTLDFMGHRGLCYTFFFVFTNFEKGKK